MRLNKKVWEYAVIAVGLATFTVGVAITPLEARAEGDTDAFCIAGVSAQINQYFGNSATVEETATVNVTSGVGEAIVSAITDSAATETDDITNLSTTDDGTQDATNATQADTTQSNEWETRLLANVEEYLYIRESADAESKILGKLYKGDAATVVEAGTEWTKITSGSVTGYVSNEFCVTGTDAQNLAQTVGTYVATVTGESVRVRTQANETSGIVTLAAAGQELKVAVKANNVDGWVAVKVDGETAYVSADYVSTELKLGEAISTEEEAAKAAAEAQAAEEETESDTSSSEESSSESKSSSSSKSASSSSSSKSSSSSSSTKTTKSSSTKASVDDATLLAALIQCEAGGESYAGQLAVGAVVINRVKSGSYPNSISGVIYQSGQFGPASSGKLASTLKGRISSSCVKAAKEAISGVSNVGSAKSFSGSGSGKRIGNHVFR